MVLPPSDHPYSYAGNDPLDQVDPTGERWIKNGRFTSGCWVAYAMDSSCPCGTMRKRLVCSEMVCEGWMWEQEYARGASFGWPLHMCYGARLWGLMPDASTPGSWRPAGRVVKEGGCVEVKERA